MKTIEGFWGGHEVKTTIQNEKLMAVAIVLCFVAHIAVLLKIFIF